MKKELKTDLRFYPLMLIKPFLEMSSGAYAGESFSAKTMDKMCEILIESPYRNTTSR